MEAPRGVELAGTNDPNVLAAQPRRTSGGCRLRPLPMPFQRPVEHNDFAWLQVAPLLPGGNSAAVPPVPIPNTEVKRGRAHGSAANVCARAGHCQASHSCGAVVQLG